MFLSCFKAELVKLAHAPIWAAFILLPAASAAIGCANYLQNLDVLGGGWSDLWTQQTLFICYFFLPPLLGVGCSYLWRLEHTGSNWNELMVQPVGRASIVVGKFLVGAILAAVSFVSITVLYLISGLVIGVPGPLPVATIALYIGFGFVGSLAIVAIQLFLSMVIRNFAVPVGIALALGVIGLLASMAGSGYVFPYSLMQSGMNSNTLVDLSLPNIVQIVCMSVFYVVVFIGIAAVWLRKRDIVAQA